MYKRVSYIIIFCTVVLAFGFTPNTTKPAKNAQKQWVVVIDPGHGGKDPGCHGVNFKEKNIALAVSLKFGHYLSDNDKNVKVVYTRTTDVFVPLNERADIANKNHADVFICIHLNASPNHDANGSATYVMGLKKSEGNLEIEKQENSSILFEKDYKTTYGGFDPNSKEANIIFSMYQNAFLTQSLDLSTKIQSEYSLVEKRKDNGVKQAGFLVLWKTAMPSLLTEIGFLTNPAEEKFMGAAKGQDVIAKSIFLAFEQYKAEKDNTAYDPSSFTYNEYSVQISDTTKPDTTTVQDEVKDSVPVRKTQPVKDSVKKDDSKKHIKKTAEQPKKDTTATASVKKHTTPKDSTSEKVNKMRNAVKDLKRDTVPPPKKTYDSMARQRKTDTLHTPPPEPFYKKIKRDTPPPKTDSVKKVAVKKDTIPKIIADTNTAYFKVQFAVADHQLAKDDKRFEGLSDIDYYVDNKIYKYTAGKFKSLKDAVDLQSKLRDKGYKDSFVVAFKGKRRITVKEAKAINGQ